MVRFFILLAFIGFSIELIGQTSNDDCFTPIELVTSLGRVCSGTGAYSSFDATFSSVVPDPICWPDDQNTADVWFSFRASGSALAITLSGNTTPVSNGSLLLPQFAIYSGVCGGLTELNCSTDGFGEHSIELVQTNLIVGQRYFIRVAGRAANQGTFQICLNSFNETPDPESDCVDGVLLCDKSSFNVQSLVGTGVDRNEVISLGLCLPDELASSWYKWECDQAGTLTFTLTPNNPVDDIDFILFELPGGLDDCDSKQAIRCMASGANTGSPLADWVRCSGPTGLQMGDPDVVEEAGCEEASNNNFVKELTMVAGQAYLLMINNFSQSGQGFNMEFGGSGTFVGPDARIDVVDGQTFDVIECDKEFTVQEVINFSTGTVDKMEWRFGVDATPQQVVGPGPHAVNYSSIGMKTITLTVTTDRGCIYNEFVNIDVLPCCDDIVGYDIILDFTTDLICHGVPTGEIGVSGIGGQPFYELSTNGMDWQFNSVVTDLDVGDYFVFIRDRKGCIDSVAASIVEPPELRVDAGPDVTIGLGCEVDVLATLFPAGTNVDYAWSSTDTAFRDPAVSGFTTFPPGSAIYTVTVTDRAGCTASDEKSVMSDGLRPIFIPNAFSPNNDGINDYFTVFANKATREIASLQVFDRWGSLVFERVNIRPNQVTQGWDGTSKGEVLNPGVYAYVIKMLFVDGVEEVYHGDISIIK